VSLLANCAVIAAPDHPPIPVEVWHVGDDALTARFVTLLKAALEGSSRFILVPTGAGKIVLGVPTHVRPTGSNRSKFSYIVDFSSREGQQLGSVSGQCEEDAIKICIEKVMVRAELVANEL
jgi:hypothetical protein